MAGIEYEAKALDIDPVKTERLITEAGGIRRSGPLYGSLLPGGGEAVTEVQPAPRPRRSSTGRRRL
ncbi:hypothetical protein ACIGV8_25950 [Streptomyces albidoflavus]